MLEYVGAPDDTRARFSGDWFITGDQGAMDDEGYITYLGRADDMMNAGGYRVSPLEVEAALADAPGIESVAVAEVAVKQDVRVIMAFYTAAHPCNPERLEEHARARLAGYKVPRAWHHLAELPLGPNGKVSRKQLRQNWSQT